MNSYFDLEFYKKEYTDLKIICKSNDDYINHWNKYGKLEERKGNNNKKKKIIFTKLIGGLGNQLFMIFNALSLSNRFDMIPKFTYDKNYKKNYKKEHNTLRKNADEYNLFKKINFNNNIDISNFEKYSEKEYKFNEIKLDKEQNYYIEGYFQSYKYFFNQIDFIKEYLNLDYNLINKIKTIYKSTNKKILSIHMRIGDYEHLQETHAISPKEYYKKALSYFNLNEYQIILFSDSILKAKKVLEDLNVNFHLADDYLKNDEEQFYMMMLSDSKICSNSSFSTMCCYFNEMFKFNGSEYIFPKTWFGPKGPQYNIQDFKPNFKFIFIDYNEKNLYLEKYDVVTTLHEKDSLRYKNFFNTNKKYMTGVGKFYYISYNDYNLNSIYLSEELYPFTKKDVINYIKGYIPNYRWGWYYQQLLKLYVFRINKIKKDYVCIFDSDILLLNTLDVFDNDTPKLFKSNTTSNIHQPYVDSCKYLFPEINIESNNSGICHFMLFEKKKLEDMLVNIESRFNKPAWQAILDSAEDYIKKNKYNDSLISEYELYYSYIKDKNQYKYENNMLYKDISIKNINLNSCENLTFIADHHYQSSKNDWKDDNLIEEEIYDNNLINDLIKKYNNKSLEFKKHYEDYCDVYFKKLNFQFINEKNIFDKLKKTFSKQDIYSIIYYEAKENIINFRKKIDKILDNILIHDNYSNINVNNKLIKKVFTNIKKTDRFHFGIVVPVFNRYNITKIFLECLKNNVNFDNILFSIVDDGSDSDVLRELENLNCINHIVICCNRDKNLNSSGNTIVPGSMYPMTLYMGHEVIKNQCSILGVLDSDSFIVPNYFKKCKELTDNIDMNNNIFTAFNSYSECHKITGDGIIKNQKILYKNMVGGISQFYSVDLYNKFKFKFSGEESEHLWSYDYDFQISNFMKKTGRRYVCLEKSLVQHIGIKTTMIRCGKKLKNNDKLLIDTVHKLLIDPNYKEKLDFNFDFDQYLKFDETNINKIFSNLNLNRFIDKIFYINLDIRTDRKRKMEEQLIKLGYTNFERISAVRPKFNSKYSDDFINNEIDKFLDNKTIVEDLFLNINSKYITGFDRNYIKSKSKENRRKYILGALGCKLSHMCAWKLSYDRNYDNILLLEDDALLHTNFNEKILELIKNIEKIDYDMVWLSPNWLFKNNDGILNRCNSYKYINDNFSQICGSKSIDGHYGSTLNNAGNIFSRKCIKYLIDNLDEKKHSEVDMWYRDNIQKNNKVFTTIPNLIMQRVEQSNIEEYLVNYDKDIHYRTRQKYNIFTIIKEDQKEKYLCNIKINLKKTIGYEKIYYICENKLFDNEILHHIKRSELENDINELKNKFPDKVNHNNIKYFYYLDIDTVFSENFFPFDENNNLIKNKNFYIK